MRQRQRWRMVQWLWPPFRRRLLASTSLWISLPASREAAAKMTPMPTATVERAIGAAAVRVRVPGAARRLSFVGVALSQTQTATMD